MRKRMYICMCDWVTLLYTRKLTEHCKQTIMEKIKNHLKKREKRTAHVWLIRQLKSNTKVKTFVSVAFTEQKLSH